MNGNRASRGAPWDVLVVGGGPAGLSAALMLGRCLRRVLVCDVGRPRNRYTQAIHGLLTREGIAPRRYLRLGRRDLRRYSNVEVLRVRVSRVDRAPAGFRATLQSGDHVFARRMVLATGVMDHAPPLPGFDRIYGRSAFHCPFCDGWEWRGRRIAAYGRGAAVVALATKLKTWSGDVVVLTDDDGCTAAQKRRLARAGIALVCGRIARLDSANGLLRAVAFADGRRLARDVLFFTTGQTPVESLAVRLGCALTRRGEIRVFRHGATDVPGLYVAGDLSCGPQFVAVAMSQGVGAAVAIHRSLIREDLRANAAGRVTTGVGTGAGRRVASRVALRSAAGGRATTGIARPEEGVRSRARRRRPGARRRGRGRGAAAAPPARRRAPSPRTTGSRAKRPARSSRPRSPRRRAA